MFQAQTIANFWLAFEKSVNIIPVINKIDLKDVKIDRVSFILLMIFTHKWFH